MVVFFTQLHIMKGVFHLRIVFNCSNTNSFFFPRQTISSVRFYYPLQIQIEKKCLKHYGEKGNMQQRNEKKKNPRVENLIEKKLDPQISIET